MMYKKVLQSQRRCDTILLQSWVSGYIHLTKEISKVL